MTASSPTGAAGDRRRIARLSTAIAAAQAFSRRQLTAEERFERDYLIAGRAGQLFW